jgi:molybdopterin molybdotransferase
MILFEKALDITLNKARLMTSEEVHLNEAWGRVLAADVQADLDMPPFDKSAVDGFACKQNDLGKILEIVETIPAGHLPEKTILEGTCARIMTGAMVPKGSECVVMIEDTEPAGEQSIRIKISKTSSNICKYAEDIVKDTCVLKAGTLLQPQHIAVLASVGAHRPVVSKRPTVAIISTGNELVDPDIMPGPAHIRDSNSHQLAAAVLKAGGLAINLGISSDEKEDMHGMILKAVDCADVVLLSGGVSMGDFDYVPSIFNMTGITMHFQKIAIQPGKPTIFGTKGRNYFFGLPGNPVSSFVLFELLVKPFLLRMMGWHGSFPSIRTFMGKDYTRRKSVRKTFIPIALRNGLAVPVEYHGSAHINAYSVADGIISMEIGKTKLKEGEAIDVRLL